MSPPPIDPLEPNDDINQVKAGGLFRVAKPLVKGTFASRVDFTDDPEDVYRVDVPAHSTLTVTMKPTLNLTLEVWGPQTETVGETGTAQHRDLLGVSTRPGTQLETVRWTNTRAKAVVVYTDVYFPFGSKAFNANFTISIKTALARP